MYSHKERMDAVQCLIVFRVLPHFRHVYHPFFLNQGETGQEKYRYFNYGNQEKHRGWQSLRSMGYRYR